MVRCQASQFVGLGWGHRELLPASWAHCEEEGKEGELPGSPWLCQAEELGRGSPGLCHPSHQLFHPMPQD